MVAPDFPGARVALAHWLAAESRWELVIAVRDVVGLRHSLAQRAKGLDGPTQLVEVFGRRADVDAAVAALAAPGGRALRACRAARPGALRQLPLFPEDR